MSETYRDAHGFRVCSFETGYAASKFKLERIPTLRLYVFNMENWNWGRGGTSEEREVRDMNARSPVWRRMGLGSFLT